MEPGNKMREVRIQEGLTQRELADLSGLSAKTISRIERGMDSVRDQTKHKVVKGLNKVEDKHREYTFDFLFEGNRV